MSRKPYGYQILRSDEAIKRIGLDRIMDDDPGSMLRGAYLFTADAGTVTGTGAVASNDTEHTLFATTARRLTVNASGAPELRITPAAPINAVDYNGVLHINLYVHSTRTNWTNATASFNLSVRFGTTINNRVKYIYIPIASTSNLSRINRVDMNRFFTISIPMAQLLREQEGFDITNISWVGVGLGSFTMATGQGESGAWLAGDYVTFDSLIFTKNITPPQNGAVVIHVDDFRKATADVIVPIANDKGVKLTIPIIPGTLGGLVDLLYPAGSAAELAAAVRQGHGVMCHTHGGHNATPSTTSWLNGMNAAQQRTFMQASQKYLLDFAAEQGVDIGNGWRHQTTHTGYHDNYSTEVFPDLFDTVCTQRMTPGVTEVTRNIVNITLDGNNEVVLTFDGADLSTDLYNGQYFFISGVAGTVELNGRWWEIERVSANNTKLRGTDSSDFSAYTDGGVMRLVSSVVSVAPFSNPLEIHRYVLNSQPIENIKVNLLRMKEQQAVIVFYLHDVAESAGDMTTANFTALLDFLNDNDIPVWTQEELGNYMRFGTPDYIEAKAAIGGGIAILYGLGSTFG